MGSWKNRYSFAPTYLLRSIVFHWILFLCTQCLLSASSASSYASAATVVNTAPVARTQHKRAATAASENSLDINNRDKKINTDDNFGILLDAGSSSTKSMIYRWSPPRSRQGLPQLSLIDSGRQKPALASFNGDLKGLRVYLRDILFTAMNEIPQHKHASTPIILMATAGLRFMKGDEVRSLLQMTRSVLSDKAINPFHFSLHYGATVLSGEEEGVYSWIAANYLNGFFDTQKDVTESVGVLEMGGGSTQITFLPNGPLYAEEFHVAIAGKRYALYVQSYLQFGINGMKVKVAQQIANQNPGETAVDDPCMLRGDTSTITLDNDVELTLKGTGDPGDCEKVLHTVLKPYTGSNCQPKPCAIGSVYQPELPNITFYATQAYTYAPESLKVVGEDGVLDIIKLRQAALKHCNRTLDEAEKNSQMDRRFASDDCLTSLYLTMLLTKSYGFPQDTTAIQITSKINGQTIDWPLGAMLMELSSTFIGDRSLYNFTCPPKGGQGVTVAYRKENNLSSTHQTGLTLLVGALVLTLINLFRDH